MSNESIKSITGDIISLPYEVELGDISMRIFSIDKDGNKDDVVCTRVAVNEHDDIAIIHNTGKYLTKACNEYPEKVLENEKLKSINSELIEFVKKCSELPLNNQTVYVKSAAQSLLAKIENKEISKAKELINKAKLA